MNDQSRVYLTEHDFEMALQEMGTIIDISTDDLMILHKKANKFAQARGGSSVTPEKLKEDYELSLHEMGTYIDITIEDLVLIEQKADKYARMRNRENILVEELMTHPVSTIRADARLSEAAHILITKRISGLPVVDSDNKLLGIITEADFLRAVGVPSQQESHNVWQTLEHIFSSPPRVHEPGELVSDLMIKNVITTTPQQTLHEVLDSMKEHQIKRLVVCDESKNVIGIITRSDVVKLFFDTFTSSDINLIKS